MEEEKNLKTRDELKKYFETGDKPTESQFGELIDSYAHLDEFNFGLFSQTKPNLERKKHLYNWIFHQSFSTCCSLYY